MKAKRIVKTVVHKVAMSDPDGGPALDELPELSLYRVYRAFLIAREDEIVKVSLPYDSPMELMLRLLTGQSWKVGVNRVEGWDDHDYKMPAWLSQHMTRLQEISEARANKLNEGLPPGKAVRVATMTCEEVLAALKGPAKAAPKPKGGGQ